MNPTVAQPQAQISAPEVRKADEPQASSTRTVLHAPTTLERGKSLFNRIANPVKAAVSKTAQKVADSTSQVHAVSAGDARKATHKHARKLSSETVGFVSGAGRALLSGTVGIATGIFEGLRGVDPIQLKRLRAARSGDFDVIGNWIEQRDLGEGPMVTFSVTSAAHLAAVDRTAFPLAGAVNMEVKLDGTKYSAVAVPLTEQESTTPVGFLIAVNDDERSLLQWIDTEDSED